MLTYETVRYRHASFYWNGEQISELKKYTATVCWPNGSIEELTFVIELRYEGYEDFPAQYGFLEITHNGFNGSLEIYSPESLALVTDLIEQ